jgi:hypothetical protein
MSDRFTGARGEWQLLGTKIDDVIGVCRPIAVGRHSEMLAAKATLTTSSFDHAD